MDFEVMKAYLPRFWDALLLTLRIGWQGVALALALDLTREQYATLLPKSVTTPIAVAVSEGHNGMVAITVAAVIVTGILGNLIAPFLVKLFRIRDPLAVGLGIGACSHAVGTAKALEMGETQGAMSGLAIAVAGIMTAILAPVVADFLP